MSDTAHANIAKLVQVHDALVLLAESLDAWAVANNFPAPDADNLTRSEEELYEAASSIAYIGGAIHSSLNRLFAEYGI